MSSSYSLNLAIDSVGHFITLYLMTKLIHVLPLYHYTGYWSSTCSWSSDDNVFLICLSYDDPDSKQNERNNDGTYDHMHAMLGFSVLGSTLHYQIFNQFQTATPVCVLLLPGTITTHAVDTSSVCFPCQTLQAEREGQAHQHPCHCEGTLWEVLWPGGVHERNCQQILKFLFVHTH